MLKKPFNEWIGGLVADACPSTGMSLDVGCGPFRYRDYYRNHVVGYDQRQNVAPDVLGPVERMPFRDRSFDYVTSFQCLYFATGVQRAVCELARVLKPGARGLVSVSGLLRLRWKHHRGARVSQLHGKRWWLNLLRDAGFSAESVNPPPRYAGPGARVVQVAGQVAPAYYLFALTLEPLVAAEEAS
jgi:SAM-dependent methyltransferase